MPNWLSNENAHNISDISLSFLTWTAMYLAIYSRKTSTRIKEKAPDNIRLKRQELGVKVASILHAAYTAYGASVCLKDFESVKGLDFFVKSESAAHYANVSAGFFTADLILCVLLIEEHGFEFVIHAISALGGSLFVSMTGIGHQYFLNLLLFEASTPFLHIRSLLLEYGYGKTAIAQLNNLIFLLTFGYFRLYRGIPVIAKMCYSLINDVPRPLSTPATIFFVTTGISMSCLNVIWFTKILKSAIKAIKVFKEKKSE
jgi:hypothetical protein